MVDTNDEWITSHTGIKTRHILKGEGIGILHGGRAVMNLLGDRPGIDPMEIEPSSAPPSPRPCSPFDGNLIATRPGARTLSLRRFGRLFEFLFASLRVTSFRVGAR